MQMISRIGVGLAVAVAAAGLAGCGQAGSSGTKAPATGVADGAGCAPVAGEQLVVLTDDKKLQSVDNIVPAVNAKASNPALIAALDKVSAALSQEKLIGLNKAVDVDRRTPKSAAEDLAAKERLADGVQRGPGGKLTIGVANFSESQTLGELYRVVLTAAGYEVTVQQIGTRELYEPALEQGQIQVVPEYVGTLTEFLNAKANGANAKQVASGDLDKTMTALRELGQKYGLAFGAPAAAADQNAFAVTKAFADRYGLKTLSDLARKCSGQASVLGGPAECPKRPFCQPGLEDTYGIKFGEFKALDAGGPQSKTALRTGAASVALVLSSDPALAVG